MAKIPGDTYQQTDYKFIDKTLSNIQENISKESHGNSQQKYNKCMEIIADKIDIRSKKFFDDAYSYDLEKRPQLYACQSILDIVKSHKTNKIYTVINQRFELLSYIYNIIRDQNILFSNDKKNLRANKINDLLKKIGIHNNHIYYLKPDIFNDREGFKKRLDNINERWDNNFIVERYEKQEIDKILGTEHTNRQTYLTTEHQERFRRCMVKFTSNVDIPEIKG